MAAGEGSPAAVLIDKELTDSLKKGIIGKHDL